MNLGSLMKVCDEMGVSKESSWPNFMEQRALKEHLQQVKLQCLSHVVLIENQNRVYSAELKESPIK